MGTRLRVIGCRFGEAHGSIQKPYGGHVVWARELDPKVYTCARLVSRAGATGLVRWHCCVHGHTTCVGAHALARTQGVRADSHVRYTYGQFCSCVGNSANVSGNHLASCSLGEYMVALICASQALKIPVYMVAKYSVCVLQHTCTSQLLIPI